MQAVYNRGVVYNADAIVAHKVFAFRTQKRWLAKRAFWQGYSKRALEVLVPETDTGEESAFLASLLTEFMPQRMRGLVQAPSVPKISQLGWLLLLTGLVGVGYLYGLTKWR